MYNFHWPYPYPYRNDMPMYPYPPFTPAYYGYPSWDYQSMYSPYGEKRLIHFKDYGPAPIAMNIEDAATQNKAFRHALWTGKHLQVTLMSINVGEDIGLERHPNMDQFIRIEEGHGLIMMGDKKDRLDFQQHVHEDYAIIIPAGKWHNLINTGHIPLKLYSIYAPPAHPHGTVHQTKAEAMSAEKHHN